MHYASHAGMNHDDDDDEADGGGGGLRRFVLILFLNVSFPNKKICSKWSR